ncbi:MAG: nucleotide exchange factor GrpE, partial [Pseudomonadota bacterium]
VLEKFGVRPVNALGEAFDPNYHEAVMEREDPDAEPKTVLEEMQKGYRLNDRLIRPSMVIVSRRPGSENG